MAVASPIPRTRLEGCIAAHRKLEAAIEGLTDEMARQPTALPGWTVGHLLTHLARNAESIAGVVEVAQRGEVGTHYPGGTVQRDGDIEAGHGRSARELIADVHETNRRLEAAWDATPEEVWATGVGIRSYGPTTIADFVFLRWREVEVHRLDLGLDADGGATWDRLDPAYVDEEWRSMLGQLDRRVPEEITLLLVPGDRPSHAAGKGHRRVMVQASPGSILQWLFGRGGDPAWPDLLPWSSLT